MDKHQARFRFGLGVRRQRKHYCWTQERLAKRAGISKRYLQKIEGKLPPDVTVDTIAKLAKALKIPVWKLLQVKDKIKLSHSTKEL